MTMDKSHEKQKQMKKRIAALERELDHVNRENTNLKKQLKAMRAPLKDETDIEFEDLFSVEDLQRIQDEFAKATGVASIITRPDGTPITRPSNFCRFCKDIIRKSKKGGCNCIKSDAVIGQFNPDGPTIQPCMSGGLWDAGAAITVGGRHIASWLAGQVRNQAQDESAIVSYSREIGVDESEAVKAFREVPRMSREKFEQISQMLYTIANQLSALAYHNVQQTRFIKEIERAQEMLIQTEKMMSIGGLAAGMAHEINNPLAGVVQNANLLANRLTQADIPANVKAAEKAGISMPAIKQFMALRRVPQILTGIIDSGMRMAGIVDNMLSFARKGDSSFSSHHPAELVDRILVLAATDYNLKKHYDFKSIRIVKEYEKNLPMLCCESGKIQQVLLNILNNGAYAMTEDPLVTDPQFTIRLQYGPGPPGVIRMEIEDNGPGMDEAVRTRIFEPFFTTKPPGVGTGLGLSVSYFIVTKNHKGTLEVRSTPGEGTRFIICLPADRKPGKK